MLSINELKDVRAIGYNIAKILDKKEMSAGELADVLSCPEIRVQAILKGSTELEYEDVQIIAKSLDVPVLEILSDPDEGIKDYNIHYMGKASNAEDMNKMLDEVDLYVRLLNS